MRGELKKEMVMVKGQVQMGSSSTTVAESEEEGRRGIVGARPHPGG
jgi:hypothetical protein